MIRALRPLSLVLIALGSAVLVPVWVHSGSAPTRADGAGPAMALDVEGPGVSCNATLEPPECVVPARGEFALAVRVAGAPDGGYVGFQTQVFYGGLPYAARAIADEVVWPESALPVRFPAVPTGQEGLVSHGDVSSLLPPFPASSHAGNVVELALACPAEAQSFTLALLAYDPADRPLGAGFRAAAPEGGIGDTLPAKGAGTASLDLDGDTAVEEVVVAGLLDIVCTGATETPGSTATLTATQTPTATATATPVATPGDAGCDGSVDSIDAALILQHVAGLLESPSCPRNADTNGDGVITSVDAALVLQFVAGLIDRLSRS